MNMIEIIVPLGTKDILDVQGGKLKQEIVDWLYEHAGEVICDLSYKHFITCPGSWYYERHPRSDIGITRTTERARRAGEVWDCFCFKDPKIATLFKLTWL